MKSKNGQIEVEILDDILKVVGENARDIVNYCGWVVRTIAPLTAHNWKGVVDRVGEQMLRKVKDKFQVRQHFEYHLDTFALATMQRLYRGWRGQLHRIYKNFQADEERLANQPEDVTTEDWKYLIDYFGGEEFQKVSARNAKNREKLVVKHTCGTRSFVEVEESTRDPITSEKSQIDEVWYVQHNRKNQEGEIVWSDPRSQEIHEQLKELASQSTSEGSTLMTGDEMLLSVLGERSEYFRGKGYGKKAQSKRGRIQEDEINVRINQAVEENTRSLEE